MAERGWQAIERGQHLRAARYALLGLQAAPSEGERFRQILARVRQDANESILLDAGRHGILNSFPSSEGDIVVAAHRFGGATVFEARSGHRLFELPGHRDEIEQATFESSRIITRSRRGLVQTWERTSGALLLSAQGEPPQPERSFFREGEIHEVASSPMFSVTYVHGAQGMVVTNRESGEIVFSEPSFVGTMAAISDVTRRLVVISSGAVHVLDTSSFQQVRSLELPPNSGPWRLSMSPDGAEVVIFVTREGGSYSSADATPPYAISTIDGTVIGALLGHTEDVHSAAYAQGGQVLVTTSVDGTTRIWRRPLGRLSQTQQGTPDASSRPRIVTTHVSPDGRYQITETPYRRGAALLLTDNTTAESHVLADNYRPPPASDELGARFGWLEFVAFTPDSRGVVVSTPYRGGAIWSLSERRPIVSLTVDGNPTAQIAYGFNSAAFSADGARLVTAGDRARVWDTTTGQLIREFGSETDAKAVDISRDGRHIVVGWNGVHVYGVDSNERIALSGGGDAVVSFTPSQSQVISIGPEGANASASARDVLSVWDYRTGSLLALQRVNGRLVGTIRFPSRDRVELAGANGSAFIWDIAATNMPLTELVRFACDTLLHGDNRQFSDEELASDPLIGVLLPRQSSVGADLCE
ncbi:MAG: hypothetical protein ABL889_11380 [Terricaulis sp.]